MLNCSITRREVLLLAAGAASFAILGNPKTAQAKTVRYAINYKLDGGTNPDSQLRKIPKGKTLPTKQLAKPSKHGYVFKGWYRNAELTERARKIRGVRDKAERTLYANWKLASYPVRYISRGGDQTMPLPAHYTMETPALSLFALSRKGWAFCGWYRDKGRTREIHKIQQGSTGELELYAKWHRAGYWTRHLFSKCSRVNTICRSASAQSDSFMFITDMHVPDNCLYSFELIDQVRERTSVKTVVYGGDSLDWSTTTKEARNILSAVRTRLTRGGTAYFVRGNHDSNDQGHELDETWGVVIFMHRYFSCLRNTEQEPLEVPMDPNGRQLNKLLGQDSRPAFRRDHLRDIGALSPRPVGLPRVRR